MKKLGLNQIRELFQSFYEEKEHYRGKSASLIPEKDKSLLLINSGMAPLKPYFSGQEIPPAKRMVTCQKCIRTGDIEHVGYTARHGTFFEMMGSFSFGDYFKKESLVWGWEFMISELQLPQDKLWASVYEEDDQAYDIWKNIVGIPEERIVRLGKEDNFWEIGTGPCGPCSEVYYDRGETYGCDNPNCKPGCECDRYIEFWNHVFTQFSRDSEGNYTDLAHPNIDTGMGLERIACIMQEVESIFEVDTLRYILDHIVSISGITYKNSKIPTDVSIRIITDHIRSVTFMIGDGIIPSNEGRRYVLRRLLRRAARHGKLLGIQEPFLADLSGKVIDTCGGAYPELEEKRAFIHKIIENEESRFNATLDQGMDILNKYMEEMKGEKQTVLEGEKAFRLYDTFGFPLELTEEILSEKGYSVDTKSFESFMEQQRKQGKENHDSQEEQGWKDKSPDFLVDFVTEFVGYDSVKNTADIKALFRDQNPIDTINEGEKGSVVLNSTVFYGESGGQAGDIGLIYNDDFVARVSDTKKINETIVHRVYVEKGEITPKAQAFAMIHVPTRNNIARNHTATHLLHKALKEVLGEHIQQEGSSVNALGLRFDFSHFEALSTEQINKIETIVNDKIDHFLPVTTKELPLDEAIKSGAIGLFDEKYKNTVRVVTIDSYSKELCGGTHVQNTGQIGVFKITGEASTAAGIRRIEAITGKAILEQLNDKEAQLDAISTLLKTGKELMKEKVRSLLEEKNDLRKELEAFHKQAMSFEADQILKEAKEINGILLITHLFDDVDIEQLRNLSDGIKAANKNVAMVLATKKDEKLTFLVSLTADVVEKGYHAGKMIKEIAAAAGGGGGGKADMAQAGAKDLSKVSEAFAVAGKLL